MASGGRGYTHLVKLLLIGDSSVGKTAVLLRYSDDEFVVSFIATIGIDFRIKSITLGDQKVKLQIWDTAGQERFRTITTAYYRGAMGIMLVFDVTNRKSFSSLKDWMHQIEVHASENVNKMLLGNKCDAPDYQRVVTTEEGMEIAEKFKMRYFDTSAKDNINVTEAFLRITTDVVERISSNSSAGAIEKASGGNKVQVRGKDNLDKNGCC